MTIQKSDIIKQVVNSIESNVNTTQVTEVINNFLDKIGENLKSEDKIQFTGFGSFNAKDIAARKGRNPQTGEEITISARRQVTFSVGKELKSKVNL